MSGYPDLHLFIGGEWIGADARDGEPVLNPATGKQIGQLPHATPADLDDAVESAARAFDSWRLCAPFERSAILRRFADLCRANADEIARAMVLDQGKPLAEARAEVVLGADFADWAAEEGRRVYGRMIPSRNPQVTQVVRREPVGVAVAFTPWNFPFSQALKKVCSALAAGCTVVLKGPEDTPSAVVALVRLMQRAGLPDGCLNMVWGKPAEVSAHLLAAPQVRKLSFTGSVPVGQALAAEAGRRMIRSTMELGGHAPVLVCDDADVEAAALALAGSKRRNAGQVCISPTRFYVQSRVYAQFAEAFTAQMAQTRIGSGLEHGVEMGPLCHARRIDAMQDLVADARDQGGDVLSGGYQLDREGFFFAPTVISGHDDMRLMREEPFGPVAALTAFDDLDEALARANGLRFGLAAYAFTTSASRAKRISEELVSGMVSINHFGLALPETPFGGVLDSGYGSEGGAETLDGYLATKFVTTHTADAA